MHCDHHWPIKLKEPRDCPNCRHWLGRRCKIENKVKASGSTSIVHEPVAARGRKSSRVTGVFK